MMNFFERQVETSHKTPSSKQDERYKDITEFKDPRPDPSEALMRKEENLAEKEDAEAEAREKKALEKARKDNSTSIHDLSRPVSFDANKKYDSGNILAEPVVVNGYDAVAAKADTDLAETMREKKRAKAWSWKWLIHRSPRNQGRKPPYKDIDRPENKL